MNCARYRALISRYLDDELTPRQRAELLDHIEHCASCSADLARFRQSDLLLRKLPAGQPGAHVKRAVLNQARRTRPRRRGVWGRLAGGGRRRVVVEALAVTLLLPLATTLLLATSTRQAIGDKLGFSTAPTATIPYLDVPASSTPARSAAFSPPHLVTTRPYDGAEQVDPGTPLVISFDQPMDRRSVEQAFHLSPPAAGTFIWDADNQVRFQPSAPGLLRGVGYTVDLTAGAHSLVGALLPQATVWSFRTVPAPAVQAVFPDSVATAVPPTVTLVITFSQAMTPDSVAPLIQLTGPAPAPGSASAGPGASEVPSWTLGGQAQWTAGGQVLHFSPAAPLPAGPVRVTLAAGGQAKAGGTVPATTWAFSVAQRDTLVTFEGPRLRPVVIGGSDPTIPYSTNATPDEPGAAPVHFAIYPLTWAALESRLPLLGADDSLWAPLNPGRVPPLRHWSAATRQPGARNPRPALAGPPLTSIPLHEKGLYLLTADTPGGQGDQRLLAAGDEGLVLGSAAGRWYVWVNKLASGLGVAGAQVRLYNTAGALLTTGVTDPLGLYRVALPPDQLPTWAFAEQDGNVSVAAGDLAWRQAAETSNDTLDATVLLDRARYQPHAIVQFTALVHPPSITLAGAVVAVRLRDPQGRDLDALTLQPDSRGAIHGAFPLGAGSLVGSYSLVFSLGDRTYHTRVPVDPPPPAADPAAIQMTVQPPAPALYAGDTITVTVHASYGSTEPAIGAGVSLVLVPQDPPADGAAPAPPALELTATIGEDGNAHVPVRLPAPRLDQEGPATRSYLLQAQAGDSLGRTGQAVTGLTVRGAHAQIDQRLPARAFKPGTSVTLTVTVHDETGRPLANQVVSSSLFVAAPAGAGASPDTDNALGSLSTVTNAEGVATATLALPLQGVFSVRSTITDSTGTPVATTARIWVYQPGSEASWAMHPLPTPGITLTPDAATYRPGDIAHLLLESPLAGGGLMLARLEDRVVSVQPITFTAGGGIIAVPIPANPGTARQVAVEFLHFAADESGPHLQTAAVSLPLGPAGEAAIDITLPEPPLPGSYVPGEPLPVHLALHNDGSVPPSGEIVIRLAAATSEAELAAPPVAAPGGPPPRPTPTGPPGAGSDSIYWNAGLALDPSGQLSTTLDLPPEEGTWDLDAWAFTASGVSHTRQILRTQPPIQVQWAIPPSLVQGDSTTMIAAVTNNQPGASNVNLRLGLAGNAGLADGEPAEQSFRLEPGETRRATWSIQATAAGSTQVTLDTAWGTPGAPGRTIHREQLVTVLPYGIPEEQTHAGSVSDSESINMTLPGDVDPATAQLDLWAAPTLPGVLAATVQALLPPAGASSRGSVDETAARLQVAATVQALYRRLGLDVDDLPAGLSTAELLDLQYLYSAQHANGGWGTRDGAPADLTTTAQVLNSFRQITQGGSPVDPGTISQGLAWLRQAAESPTAPGVAPPTGPGPPPPALAEAIYVLSLYNQAPPGSLDRLLGAEPQLTPSDRAFLALALGASGRAAEARLVVDRLAGAGAVSSDPLVLEALLDADHAGVHGPVVAVAQALLGERQGASWSTPPLTAAAVLALSHYIQAVPESNPLGTYRVLVNGQVLQEVPVGPGTPHAGRVLLAVPGTRLHTGDNSVRFETNGVHLYYSLRARAVRAAGEHPIASRRADNGTLGLLRAYQSGPGAATTVVLTLTLSSPVDALQLDDPLPAGWARLPGLTFTRLADPPAVPAPVDLRPTLPPADDPPTGPGLHLLLPALAPGQYMLTYAAVPLVPGSYSALPALLQVLANPANWVRSGGDSLLLDR
ncbi:MAG TPA: Ig-like domain-containing protein [Chloroflexia bacterium]|nr:Ig-like domain-containing protein [Chloroflexia bacterium]